MFEADATIRVLHVDDEPAFTELVAEFLEREDDRIDVRTATTVAEGLEILEAGELDCVVSDYDMPVRNGIEFLEAVRETWPDLPFVLYTGKGSEEVAAEALSAGATDYLQKETGTDQYAVLANRITNAVEQRRARAARREMERQLSELTNRSPDVLWMFDGDWSELLFINEAYEEVYGRPRSALRSDPHDFLAAVHPDDRDGVERAMHRLFDGVGGSIEYRVNEADDYRRWVHAEGVPITDEDGTVVRAAGFSREITGQKRRERRLRETSSRLEALFEQSPDMVNVHDEEGTIIDWNPRLVEKTGYDGAELDGMKVWELDRGLGPEAVETVWERMEDGDSERLEREYRRRDGSTFPVEAHIRRVDIEGEPRFIAISRDITDRKERERTLQRERDRFKALFEALPVPAVRGTIGEGTPTVEQVNPAFEEVFGYDGAELQGKNLDSYLAPGSLAGSAGSLNRQVTETGQATERVRRQTADGIREFKLEAVVTDSDRAEEGYAIYVPLDEEPASGDPEAREAKIEALHDVAVELRAVDDPAAVYERIVDAAEEILAFDRAIADRVEDGQLVPVAVAEDLDPTEYYEATPVDEEGNIAAEVYRTGEPSIIDDLTEHDAVPAGSDLRSGLTVPIGEYGILQAVAEETAAFTRSELELVSVLTSHAEATLDRISHEQQLRERTEELERQNERLEEFASVVSHDLRNPLHAAEGYLELAREESDSDHLASVAGAHERMETLIDELLSLAREGATATDLEPVDIAAVAEGCWDTVETSGLSLVVDIDRTARVEKSRLKQLFENLMRNAVEHGENATTVSVGELPDGFYIEDDGVGIPAGEHENVFDAGYSTAEEGTGFGLSIVEEIVEAHGWTLHVTEGSAGGARFEITGVEFVGD